MNSTFATYDGGNGQTPFGAANDYVLSVGATSRTPDVPAITTNHQQSSPMSPSPRLRVAFNRETNFVLEPAQQQQIHGVPPTTEHNLHQHQEQMQALHTPEAQMAEICDPEFETPSPKSTLFDLKYQKPGLYRENSGFDGETAHGRHFARQVSRRQESPQRRRTPQKVELRTNHDQDADDDDKRGRRRRRIGSEMDQDMADG